MQETRVQSLGWEDPLERGMATHSSIPALGNPVYSSWDRKRVRYDSTHAYTWVDDCSSMEQWNSYLASINCELSLRERSQNHLVKGLQTRLFKRFPNFFNSWCPLMFQPFSFKLHPVQRSQSRARYRVILLICEIQAKHNTNELIYKTEIDPQTQKINLSLTKGE